MQRTLRYTVAGICADVEAVSAAITQACRQSSGPYRVRDVVQAAEQVYVLLLPAAQGPLEVYHFAEVCDCGEDELVARLAERWEAGFDAIGSVWAGDGLLLVLFARPEVPA
jgi:hypothetical protein